MADIIKYELCDTPLTDEEHKLGLADIREIEFSIINPFDSNDPDVAYIQSMIDDVDNRINDVETHIALLNKELDKLTCHADGWDYTAAVVSGVLTGLIDSFLLTKTEGDIKELVTKYAEKQASKSGVTISSYEDAQKFLEKKYHTPNDSAYQHGQTGIGGRTHRLDDFAHHPTLAGLAASIIGEFIRIAIFSDRNGKLIMRFLPTDAKTIVKIWTPAVISGLMSWLAHNAVHNLDKLDSLPEPLKKLIKLVGASPIIVEVTACTQRWAGHIMSDVATSAGIPGIFLSLLKEISALPFIKDTRLPEYVKELYESKNFNFDKDLIKLKGNATSVVINECLVRGFYFVRHFYLRDQSA